MSREKNYMEVLVGFFEYYQEQCERFICTQKGNFSGEYFSDWYYKTGIEILEMIKKHLNISQLDEKVVGFIELYRFYIDSAWDRNDVDLLLENLFLVPVRMQCEFSEFGFLTTEALTDEQDWLFEDQSEFVSSVALTIKPDVWKKRQGSYQYVIESDLSNRALLI